VLKAASLRLGLRGAFSGAASGLAFAALWIAAGLLSDAIAALASGIPAACPGVSRASIIPASLRFNFAASGDSNITRASARRSHRWSSTNRNRGRLA